MITRPLELESRLSPPPRDLDFFAWVNVAVIVLFFVLFGSQAVLLPGVLVGVRAPEEFKLPTIGANTEDLGAASVVVSYRRDNVILFDGGKYSLPDLQKEMAAYVRKHPKAVLLMQFDGQVSMQAFVDLANMARLVGFDNVRVAAETSGPETPPNPGAADAPR